jgi:hypothetical protein
MERPVTLKWTKKEKESHLEALKLELDEGQGLAFVEMKDEHWMVLVSPIKGHIDGTILDITQSIAGLLGRRFGGKLLKGLKYDSPAMISKELRERLGFKEDFFIQVF